MSFINRKYFNHNIHTLCKAPFKRTFKSCKEKLFIFINYFVFWRRNEPFRPKNESSLTLELLYDNFNQKNIC